ncbi:class I SAM-dependent methyltransferase [Shewanella algae]|uniref:class I SAM-dependent methyltransferase n=1 Tax=Shewanella algae TaxID=38313 RepID=UPI001AAD9414|nr:class I SAM-dependent methyltransferase [Shewanella algae]MBO2571385.1 class I SAM-dependent methyltransferase [Shewanella algae]
MRNYCLGTTIQRKFWRRSLGHWLNQQGWQRGVELGVKSGRSTAAMLSVNPGLQLTGIDLWQNQPGNSAYANNAENERKARRICRRYSGLTLLKGDALQLAGHFSNASQDFVFYDLYDYRCSNTEFVTQILRLWYPQIAPGGAIVGRDFDNQDCLRAFADLGLPRPVACIIRGRAHPRLKAVFKPKR